jgi:N-acetyl-beta-hexosaminidase
LEKGLLLDIARKDYTLEQLKRFIDLMARLEMNTLQLHFSDNEGCGIESKVVPEMNRAACLSQKEAQALIAYAKAHGIAIIPEFDSPGHLRALLKVYPEFQLQRVGQDSAIFPAENALDITNPQAVALVKSLIKEYLELFSESEYFHLGGDEFIPFHELDCYPVLKNAETGYPLFIDYVNDLARFVQAHGKTPRIWNDGIYQRGFAPVSLDKAIQVTYWTNYDPKMPSVDEILAQGHQVLNFNDNYFYFVIGETESYKYPTAEKIKDWQPALFSGKQWISEAQLEQVAGYYFSIWGDHAEALTPEQILTMIEAPLTAQQQILNQ